MGLGCEEEERGVCAVKARVRGVGQITVWGRRERVCDKGWEKGKKARGIMGAGKQFGVEERVCNRDIGYRSGFRHTV